MNPPDHPTPRTNAIAHRGYPEPAYIVEMTDLARTLERELTEAQADSLKAHQMTCAAALERDAEREKVRVLREALDEAQSCGGLTGSIFMQARAALAATEAKP
jgi:hypothetical protein